LWTRTIRSSRYPPRPPAPSSRGARLDAAGARTPRKCIALVAMTDRARRRSPSPTRHLQGIERPSRCACGRRSTSPQSSASTHPASRSSAPCLQVVQCSVMSLTHNVFGRSRTNRRCTRSSWKAGNGLWPRRLRRWQIPAIPAVRTCDALAPAPHTEPDPKFGVHPRRPVGVARKAGLLPATEPGKKRCVGMALGGQPSRGRTVRTRVMKTPNASMKSRRNCSVVLSVTSPSSVISPGVNWM
jgi:hypothetical protein